MNNALGSGWLIALIALVPTLMTAIGLPFVRWVAARWRARVELEKAARNRDRNAMEEIKTRLQQANEKIMELTWKFNECELRRMLAEERVSWYEKRLERAESDHAGTRKGVSDERS